MLRPDHPDRIAVSAAGDAAAFVIGPAPDGPSEATGLWYGPLSGQPAKISDLVPDTNLAFAPRGAAFALAVHHGEGSRLIVADPAAGAADWAEHRLPVFAERVAWTTAGLIVLAAEPGADTASLTSGKPLTGGAEDPVVARAAAGWRRLWLVDAATGTAAPVSPDDLAVWEFAPVPGGGAVVVASDDPTEAGWYHSSLIILDAGGQRTRVLRESPWQLSSPAVSPDGHLVAYVEGWASDRGLLAGEVQLSRLDGAGHRDASKRRRRRDLAVVDRRRAPVAGRLAPPRDRVGMGRRPGQCLGQPRRPAGGQPERMARGGVWGGRPPECHCHSGGRELPQLALAPRGRPAGRRLGAGHAVDTGAAARGGTAAPGRRGRPVDLTQLPARWLAEPARAGAALEGGGRDRDRGSPGRAVSGRDRPRRAARGPSSSTSTAARAWPGTTAGICPGPSC